MTSPGTTRATELTGRSAAGPYSALDISPPPTENLQQAIKDEDTSNQKQAVGFFFFLIPRLH